MQALRENLHDSPFRPPGARVIFLTEFAARLRATVSLEFRAPQCFSEFAVSSNERLMVRGLASLALGLLFIVTSMSCRSRAEIPAELEENGLPDWVMTPPHDPGSAFYAAASGTARREKGLALEDAKAAARTALARSLDTTVQSVFKRYLSEIQPEESDGASEVLIQDTSRLLTDLRLSGMRIERTFPNQDGTWWALASIAFDDVAQVMKSSARRHLDSVRQNSDAAFDELERLLKEEAARQER